MATSEGKIILFDLPTKKPEYGCWSPNVWKSRMVLNYKKLPYSTKFVTHEEIEPALAGLNIPANEPGPGLAAGHKVSRYTVPAIQLPDGTAIMDSDNIVKKLEELHPEPSLHLDNDLHNKIIPVLVKLAGPITALCYPRIRRDILLPETVPGWIAKKESNFGYSIDEMEKTKGGEKAWQDAQPGFEMLRKFLKEHKVDEGPFVTGSQVSYVDFLVASMLESFRRIGSELYERFCQEVPDVKVVHQACGEWLKEDR